MERIESSTISLPLLEAITPERLAGLLDQSKAEREQLFTEQYKKFEQVVINQKITALEKKREQGLKHRGPDTKPRKTYELNKPFVNRNTPASIAKRKETLAKKKLIMGASQ